LGSGDFAARSRPFEHDGSVLCRVRNANGRESDGEERRDRDQRSADR
jgi:hypothetical protein